MANESDVVLNPGVGGSLVRTIQVPTSVGNVEQQVVVQADRYGQMVNNDEILQELRKISGALQLLLWEFNNNVDPLEINS